MAALLKDIVAILIKNFRIIVGRKIKPIEIIRISAFYKDFPQIFSKYVA